MYQEATPFWLRPLPIFIQVIGYLAIIYALLMFAAMIGMTAMSLYWGGSGSFELATDFGRKYYENGYSIEPLMIKCGGLIVFFIVFGLIFFSGFRMARGINKKGLAEYSSIQALWIAGQVDIIVRWGLGYGFYFSLIAWAIAIASYCLVRFNLYPLLKRILLDQGSTGS